VIRDPLGSSATVRAILGILRFPVRIPRKTLSEQYLP
jgi:hypothetical protein